MRLSWQVLSTAIFVFGLLLFIYGNSLWQLLRYQQVESAVDFFTDPYLKHIIFFSFWQALLSAILSVFFGLLAAHSLYYQSFIGKSLLIKMFSLTMVLPALVAVFGLIGIYGKSGWINQLFSFLGLEASINIYGLTGILIAHVFFNLPLSAKIFLQTLSDIPSQQRKLAAQLKITNWQLVKLLEWPYLKPQILSVFALVFMLCFTSFTLVLTLGGGPKYTTLEVAIYQAITFDFDLSKAAIFALMQFVFCFMLFYVCQLFSKAISYHQNSENYVQSLSKSWQWTHNIFLCLVVLFVLLPLLNILFTSFDLSAWQSALGHSSLYVAMGFSFVMAPLSGILCVVLSSLILWVTRSLDWLNYKVIANQLSHLGMMILAVPALVLAVGLYLLLRDYSISTSALMGIVIICNALMAMPFVLRLLTEPFYHNMDRYQKLCEALNISGVNRFRYIEWHHLKRPMRSAFALSTALSLGDFTVIALFGNQHFTSLPRLLYQQLGFYRSQDAAVTGAILLLACMLLFLLIEQKTNQ